MSRGINSRCVDQDLQKYSGGWLDFQNIHGLNFFIHASAALIW